MDLTTQDIKYCKGVGSKRADVLRKELKVETPFDLLQVYPYKYTDHSKFYKIADIESEDTSVQIIGEFLSWETIGVGRGQRLSATFTDGTSTIECVWFAASIRFVHLAKGVRYLLFGKPSLFNHVYNFTHPELTPLSRVTPEMTQGLEPDYVTSEKMKSVGLNSRGLRNIMRELVIELRQQGAPEIIGADVLAKYHLIGRTEALCQIHFPTNNALLQKARERLKFEELFYLQLRQVKQLKKNEEVKGFSMPIVGKRFNYFYAHCLPFSLTDAQKRVMHEIQDDLKSGTQMNRLLQGDVGSGKTVVALFTMLLAVDNGYKACLMAPTEILAQQHYDNIRRMLRDTPVQVALLTGSTTKKQREPIHRGLLDGSVDILIGTHALIEDDVHFLNVGLCIIDEQHRFGVAQRSKLWGKNATLPPHILIMTATPIPRTLAMSVYGDLKQSIIDELPPGRKPIQTIHYGLDRKRSLIQFLRSEISKGRQAYIVYPLIKENEKLDLQDLENGYNEWGETFPEYKISMVHGKMKAKDKDAQMQRFISGETQILVATTVIEVGVDVPNASIMVVVNAERFGLSQLHQLRGRVGRGADQSYCLLLTRYDLSKDTRKRMEVMVETNNGFRIADVDMQLRGYGELEGTRQSGLPVELKIASIVTDGAIMSLARQAAQDILDNDPHLDDSYNEIYKRRLNTLRLTDINWADIS